MNKRRLPIGGIGRSIFALAFSALLLSALLLSLQPATAAPLSDAPLPTFLVSKPFGNASDKTVALAVGDMNDDGALDIVTANEGEISYVYFNDGQGGFVPQQSAPFRPNRGRIVSVAVGDMDADGDLDIVAGVKGGQSAIYLNTAGTFAKSVPFGAPTTGAVSSTIALGDVDGDADYDIVVGYFKGQSVVFLNGGGTFYTGTVTNTVESKGCAAPTSQVRCFGASDDQTRSVALGDMDGDRHLDIVVGYTGQQNRVYFNTSDASGAYGFFSTQHSSLFGDPNEATRQVTVGDMDDNGHLDIIAIYADSNNPHRIYLNDGHGRFPNEGMKLISSGAATVGQKPDAVVSVAVGDIDSDGDLDILVGIGTSGWLDRLYYNDGHANFTQQKFGNPARRPRVVALGDFNGDGFLDLIHAQGLSNTVAINSGQGEFAPVPITARTIEAYSARIWNINKDNVPDIVIGNYGGRNLLFVNDGAGRFPSDEIQVFGEATGKTTSIAFGDFDRDGYPDIAEGNESQQSFVYLNDGSGNFTHTARIRPFGPSNLRTFSISTGDVNGDDTLDIVAGNFAGQNAVYLNVQGTGQFITGTLDCSDVAHIRCFGTGKDNTWSVALGDVNGDGALDIAVGNEIQQSLVYLNDGSGRFASNRVSPFGSLTEATYSVAIGDLNGDGAPDIVAGNFYGPSRVHLNDGAGNFPEVRSAILGTGDDRTYSIVLADMNDDGALDIIFGIWYQDDLRAYQGNLVYLNDGRGGFSNDRVRTFRVGNDYVRSVDVGDLNGDGAPDIVAGMRYQNTTGNQSRYSVVIYPNPIRQAQHLPGTALGISVEPMCRGSSLSCAVGNNLTIPISYTLRGAQDQRARRIEGWYTLADEKGWQRIVTATTAMTPTLLANEAGRLDWNLAASGIFGRWDDVRASVRAYPSLRPYTNSIPGPYLWPYAVATTPPFSLAGAQVRVVGLSANDPLSNAIVYRIASSRIRGNEALSDAAGRPLRTNELGDLGGHNQFDVKQDRLVALWPSGVITDHMPLFSYFSDNLAALPLPSQEIAITTTTSITVAHPRRIGVITDQSGPTASKNMTVPIVAVGISLTQSARTTITGYLDPPRSPSIKLFTSVAPTDTRILDLSFDDSPLDPHRTFQITGTGIVTGTFPLSDSLSGLRGTMADGGWILRLVSDGPPGSIWSRGGDGGFSPPSELHGWRLSLQESPLYYTSAEPSLNDNDLNDNDLKAAQLEQASQVHTLTVSSTYPLLLFDLDIALEWDTSKDDRYREQLKADLERASEILYDWTNGQAALGLIRVYDDAKRTTGNGTAPWNDAHIRIYATNRLRPNAVIGGIVSQPISDPLKSEIRYFPGQVQMGATWNRFGESTGNLDDDWARALAHELGHYLFFLDDNYLGKKDGVVVPIRGCSGAMGNIYSDDETRGYGEFHADDLAWEKNCGATLSQIVTQRSDWKTITTFYPWLSAPITDTSDDLPKANGVNVKSGPNNLPLDVTQVRFGPAQIATTTPNSRYFDILRRDDDGLPRAQERAFLIKADELSIVDLGVPGRDQMLVRGAQAGDMLCILGADKPAASSFERWSAVQGCKTIRDQSSSIELRSLGEWHPNIEIVQATSRTLDIKVSQPSSDDLEVTKWEAQLFPVDGTVVKPIFLEGGGPSTPRVFTGHFDLGQSAAVGHILVRARITRRQDDKQPPKPTSKDVSAECRPDDEVEPCLLAIADYTLGGSPASIWSRGGTANIWSRGGTANIWSRGGGGANFLDAHRAPMVSPDGQAILYGDSQMLTDTLVMLQSTTALPPYPAWLKPVGRGYRLKVFDQKSGSQLELKAAGLISASLNIGYLSGDVPKGGQSWIRAYYWNEKDCQNWCLIDTRPDLEQGSVSVRLQGPGIYVLMSSIEIPVQAGWNMFGYPVEVSRPVTEALASIAGNYTMIYSYDPSEQLTPTARNWRAFSPDVEVGWANDLAELEFGRGYLIHVTQPITLYLAPGAARPDQTPPAPQAAMNLSFGSPPAVFYGAFTDAQTLSPTAPITVTAWVNDQQCGEAPAIRTGSALTYVLKVAAGPGCGAPGVDVTLRATNGLTATANWDNHRMHPLTLTLTGQATTTPTIQITISGTEPLVTSSAPITSAVGLTPTRPMQPAPVAPTATVTPIITPSIRAATAVTATATPTATPTRTPSPTPSPTASPRPVCVELAHNGGFDGSAGWTLPDTQSRARIVADPAGGHALQLGLAPGETPGRATTGIASAYQRFRIPADARTVTLSFRYRANFGSGSAGRVLFLNPGSSAQWIELWRTTAQSRDWLDATVDIAEHRGRDVQLYFEASPGPRAGMTIDDVRVQVCR